MPTDLDPGPGRAPEVADLPTHVGTIRRHRRRHDRSKYPWRYQRLRRKLIQITLVSSLALLFLCGALYVMLTASSRPRSNDSDGEASSMSTFVRVVSKRA